MQVTWNPQRIPDIGQYDRDAPEWIDGRSFALLCPELEAWQKARERYMEWKKQSNSSKGTAGWGPYLRNAKNRPWMKLSAIWDELRRQWATACTGTPTRTKAREYRSTAKPKTLAQGTHYRYRVVVFE